MDLTFKIRKPVSTVFDYLTDMQKLVTVHPVITRIDSIGGNNYLVHETLKMWFIPYSFQYKVTVEQNFNDKKVVISATIMKKTKVEMNYVLHADGDTTTINETIIVTSPLPVRSVVENIFKKQHALLFKNIESMK